LAGYNYTGKPGDMSRQVLEFWSDLAPKYAMVSGSLVRNPYQDSEVAYFKMGLQPRGNMTLTHASVSRFNYPSPLDLYGVAPEVRAALMRADYRYFEEEAVLRTGKSLQLPVSDFVEFVWCDRLPKTEQTTPMTLQQMCLRKISRYRMALGRYRHDEHNPQEVGRLPAVSAMANLYQTHKSADAVLLLNKNTHKPPAAFAELTPLIPKAIQMLYKKMGVKKFGKIRSRLSLKDLIGMALHASAGLNKGTEKNVKVQSSVFGEEKVRITPSGQKHDTFPSDLRAVYDFVVYGIEPHINFNVTNKNEVFTSAKHVKDDAKYDAWCRKVRNFVIPSSVFILLERLVTKVRHLMERGKNIRIGSKWAHGGMDKVAEVLRANLGNCFQKLWESGDIEAFDHSVLGILVDIFMSTMLIHEKPGSEDYNVKERVCRFLLKNLLARVTHVFGEVWVIQRGGVPSGIYDTSHLDSWVTFFYWSLFCLHTIVTAPEELQDKLEQIFWDDMDLACYGDDQVYCKGRCPEAEVFNIIRFSEFLSRYFGVVMRDLESGQPFCSVALNGYMLRPGQVFLKHYAVRNPYHYEVNQPNFLPYRSTFDYVVKAAWGREVKARDSFDVVLSIIGHAYGTYASNRDAWISLRLFYEELLIGLGTGHDSVMKEVRSRVETADLKKFRQMGVTDSELMNGFPTWRTLISRNLKDDGYHASRRIDPDVDSDLHFE
jgi:hypothetical protein